MTNELLAIADYIEEHGHARRVYTAPNGAVCVIGALNKIRGNDGKRWITSLDTEDPTIYALQNLIGTCNITRWSDVTGTKELLAQLRGQTDVK